MFNMLLNLAFGKLFSIKKTDLTGVFIIKPSHPDGLKKTQIWVEKTSNGSPAGLV